MLREQRRVNKMHNSSGSNVIYVQIRRGRLLTNFAGFMAEKITRNFAVVVKYTKMNSEQYSMHVCG